MHIIGIGLHILVALFFAIHAMRTGRNMFWLIVLFSFPLLGSIVYFFVEFWPEMRSSRAARVVGGAARNMLDPQRELREAKHAFELAETNGNRMRLASALLNAGHHSEAITQLNACLAGQHANDPDVLSQLARAHMETGDAAGTARALKQLIERHPSRNTGDVALLYARALGAAKDADTESAFQHALKTGSGAEPKLRYGQWLASTGAYARAREQFEAIRNDAKHWTPHAKSLNKAWLRDAEKALVEIDRLPSR